MKILMVHKTKKGGVNIQVNETSRELEKLGHKVDEITRVEDLEYNSFFKSYFKLKKLFKKWSNEYDIVHVHDWSITYPAIRSGISNIVATFHGFAVSTIANRFENYCIKKLGKKSVVISPNMKNVYRKSTYIPNGIDLDKFKSNRKTVKDIIGVAQDYNKKFIVKTTENYDFDVRIAENVEYNNMPEFYSGIEIFISIPPKETGFNMVWLEAMACEVPYIIGTDVGIGTELPIYKIGEHGNSLDEILNKIKNNELKPLKDSRKWILENKLTWTQHANELDNLYRRCGND